MTVINTAHNVYSLRVASRRNNGM